MHESAAHHPPLEKSARFVINLFGSLPSYSVNSFDVPESASIHRKPTKHTLCITITLFGLRRKVLKLYGSKCGLWPCWRNWKGPKTKRGHCNSEREHQRSCRFMTSRNAAKGKTLS
jgi:hypothetical protein